jgi:hypothetical protein
MVFLLLGTHFFISSERGCPEDVLFLGVSLYAEFVQLFGLQEEECAETPSYIHIDSNDFSYRK